MHIRMRRSAASSVVTIDARDRESMSAMLAKLGLGGEEEGAGAGGKEDEDDLLTLMDAAARK